MNQYEKLGRIENARRAAARLDPGYLSLTNPEAIRLWYDKAKEIVEALTPLTPQKELLTEAMISDRRDYAATAGDDVMVRVCDQALEGDWRTRRDVARSINAARQKNASEPFVLVVYEEEDNA